MKINLKKILYYIILFYIIYTPTISGSILFNYNVTMYIISAILIALWLIKNKGKNIVLKKEDIFFTLGIFIATLYCFCVYCFRINEFNLSDSRLMQNFLIILYMIDVYILSSWVNKDEKENVFFNMVVNLAIFQGIISIIMVIFPNLHQIALNFYYKGNIEQNVFINRARIYGISYDYTFATPIYHGFLASIVFKQYLNTNNFKKLIKCILIIIPVLLNGRTGLVIFGVSCVIYLIYFCFFKHKVWVTIKTLGIITVAILTIAIALRTFVPYTYNFIAGFFKDTTSLISDKEYKGNYAILKRNLFFPQGSDIIFGRGFRVYGGEASKYGFYEGQSDIGYVNDLFQGGIIYVGILYISIFYLIIKKVKNKPVAIALIISLLLANYKGEIFHSITMMFLIMLLCVSGQIPYIDTTDNIGGKNEKNINYNGNI